MALWCHVVQVWNPDSPEDEVLAMVCRTGLNTLMGAMVKDLLAPLRLCHEKDPLLPVCCPPCMHVAASTPVQQRSVPLLHPSPAASWLDLSPAAPLLDLSSAAPLLELSPAKLLSVQCSTVCA